MNFCSGSASKERHGMGKKDLALDGHYSWYLRRTGRCAVFRGDRSSAADSFLRQCVISCVSTRRLECTPDISPVIPHPTAVSECRNKTPSSSSARLKLARRFTSSEERCAHAITSSTVRSHRDHCHMIA